MALTFGAIFVVELPDKTFLATLVMATRYRPLLVWIGVSLAFAVQTIVAVLLGHAVSFLPVDLVHSFAAAMFLIGARPALSAKAAPTTSRPARSSSKDTKDVHGARVVLTCFLVLFAAEWGDLCQLLTITLVARYEDPVSVFIGALAALLAVTGLAVVVGRGLLRYVSLHVLHYIGAAVCLALAVATIAELVA